MLKVIILSFSLISSFCIYSQSSNDSIQKVNLGLSHCYKYNGQILTFGKMTTIMNGNIEASNYLRKAKTSNVFSIIFGIAGGYCMAYPIAKSLSGKQPNWSMFAGGCGLTAVYIPIVISTNKNVKLAVSAYNKAKKATSYRATEYSLQLGLSHNELGLILKF